MEPLRISGFFVLDSATSSALLNLPESGMGFQVIKAKFRDWIVIHRAQFVVLNALFAFPVEPILSPVADRLLHRTENWNSKAYSTHFQQYDLPDFALSEMQNRLTLEDIALDQEGVSFFSEASEPSTSYSSGGLVPNANGDELFVRLSDFQHDRRIDFSTRKLLPGSYTTTASDYLLCRYRFENPVARYALPVPLPKAHHFQIQPKMGDSVHRGWVTPNFGQPGGGREAFFPAGTSPDTLLFHSHFLP